MPKRNTDSEKWEDPWFCSLNPQDKLFWIYLCDKCNHAGIWKVNWQLAKFHVGQDYKFDETVFNGRIKIINEEKWFLVKYVLFQQNINSLEELTPINNCRKSIINILTKEGILNPCLTLDEGLAKGDGNGNGNGKGKEKRVIGRKTKKSSYPQKTQSYPQDDFIKEMEGIYTWIDINTELKKIDGWLLAHPGRKKTKRFIINWFNRIEKPMGVENGESKKRYL